MNDNKYISSKVGDETAASSREEKEDSASTVTRHTDNATGKVTGNKAPTISQTTDNSSPNNNNDGGIPTVDDSVIDAILNEGNNKGDSGRDNNAGSGTNEFGQAFASVQIDMNDPRLAEHFPPQQYTTTYQDYVNTGKPKGVIISDLPS